MEICVPVCSEGKMKAPPIAEAIKRESDILDQIAEEVGRLNMFFFCQETPLGNDRDISCMEQNIQYNLARASVISNWLAEMLGRLGV